MSNIEPRPKAAEPEDEHRFATIAALGPLIRQGKLSPVSLTAQCLMQIEKLNPSLNAFITVTADQALAAAQAAAREIVNGQWRGPLHGIPIGIKDFFDTAGIRTTAAFEHFRQRVPARDAVSVTRLKEAGAIVLGKMNMHELGMGTTSTQSCFGSVHNPWNTAHVAGGSSGGSAAAVAAGLCYATLDTDAIGSCRLPAACCGVTGFKPGYGLISLAGVLEGEPVDETILRLAHAAVSCRSAADAALLLDVLAADRPLTAAAPAQAKPARLGIVRNASSTEVLKDLFAQAVQVLRELGHTCTDIELPFASATFDPAAIDQARSALGPELFQKMDALLLPTLTDTPPTLAQASALGPQAVSPDNTFFFNFHGLPAITVPCGFSPDGLPVGLQIAGPPAAEAAVLALAQSFQQATSWHRQHPQN